MSKPTMVSMAVALATGLLLFTTTAAASEGLSGSPAQLPAAERAKLAAAIDGYRATHPQAFEALRQVKGHRPEVYRKARNPKPMVGPELRRLGAPALLPMLEALAFAAPERRGATAAEWQALQVGMLQAVGLLRDPRSAAVLALAFDQAGSEPVVRAAAEALGRLCDPSSHERLSDTAAASGPRRFAAVRGLGWCRNQAAVEQLADLLEGAQTESFAAVVAEALGVMGSSWAWRALGSQRAAEGLAIREVTARALVPAFIRWHGVGRKAAGIALTMVEHPDLRSLVSRHRAQADRATAAGLDRIVRRVEKRRVHRP